MKRPNERKIQISHVLLVLALVLVLAGCVGETVDPNLVSCSQRRLDVAVIAYEDAKEDYLKHLSTRSDVSLTHAFHTTDDAIRVARSVKFCGDFTKEIQDRATDIIWANRYLQQLIYTTMRDSDPGVAIGIFGNKYRDIFDNDIN